MLQSMGLQRVGRDLMPEQQQLVIQWLELAAFTAEDAGLIPGQGAKISQSAWLPSPAKNKPQKIKVRVIFNFFALWFFSSYAYSYLYLPEVKFS